jgi:hypothetical protein
MSDAFQGTFGFTNLKVGIKVMRGGKATDINSNDDLEIMGMFALKDIRSGEVLASFEGEKRKPSKMGEAWAIS